MAITNGYATLQEFKDYAFRDQQGTEATDDGVIETLVEAASRAIDAFTGRTFYGRSETRKYDTPRALILWLDDDLLSVTSQTNGDGSAIDTADWVYLPANATPKCGIMLLGTSGMVWQVSNTTQSPRQAISVEGTWGFSASAPANVNLACLILARDAYFKRYGNEGESGGLVTADGVRILPAGFPLPVRDLLSPYRRKS